MLTPTDDVKHLPDKIGLDGAQSYLGDLNVELDDIALLCLCELLQCPSIGEFDRETFISGWQSAVTPSGQLDTINKQSSHIATLRKRLPTDGPYFKRVYRYAFNLAKPPGQKSVPIDSALEFWQMFFSSSKGGVEWNGRSTAWLDEWLKFYEEKGKRPVNKDLWNMVYELMVKTTEPGGEDLSWWNEDGAWPMAVDEFVGEMKVKKGGVETMDTT
jgi:DCN1-like protein 1/2